MDDDKTVNLSLEAATRGDKGDFAESSSRARNRTVMLTPEITGQVRARLAQGPGQDPHAPLASAQTQLLGGSGGFESVRSAPNGSGLGGGMHSRHALPEPTEAPRQPSFTPPVPQRAVVADREGIVWVKESPVVGFLVSYDTNENGQVYELRVGRVMVTNQSQGETNTLVIKSDSVSPMHAIVRVGSGGDIQVLDQLSENGTTIRRFATGEEEHLAGDKGALEHGDIVRFGERSFHVCIVPRVSEE